MLPLSYALLSSKTLAAYTTLYGDYQVELGLDPNDYSQFQMKVRMRENTWIGFSIGATGMTSGTDMIQIDGAGQDVFDMVS